MGFKLWAHKKATELLDWMASTRWIKNPPRFWTKEEWAAYSSKEKVWIFYNHIDYLIGIGNGEIDRILPFMRWEFVTSVSAVSSLLILLKAPVWLFTVYPIFYVLILKIMQGYVGLQFDKRDLMPLKNEVNNRRVAGWRQIRKMANREEWRKIAKANDKK